MPVCGSVAGGTGGAREVWMSPGTRDSQSVLGELSYVCHKRPATRNDVSKANLQQYVFPAIGGVIDATLAG